MIVLWDDLIVVVEAKLGSANDRQTRDLWRFNRYLRRQEQWAPSREEIKAEGRYELARNWVIAWELTERTGADLAVPANLAPAVLADDVASFRTLVATSSERRVTHVHWQSLLADPSPDWLKRYATSLALRDL